MAHIERKPNGTYLARYRDPSGKLRSKAFKRKGDATEYLKLVSADMTAGNYVDPRMGELPYGVLAEHYWATEVGKAQSTRFRDRSYFDNHITPRWATTALGDITPEAIEVWVAALSKTLMPATVTKIYQLFKLILALAVERKFLAAMPTPKRNPTPRIEPKRPRFLDESQIAKLAGAIDRQYGVLVWLGCYGGFRIGEMLALKRNDIDFARGRVVVDETLVELDGGSVILKSPKTARSQRSVAMPPSVMQRVEAHLAEYVPSPSSSALLFTLTNGAPVRYRQWLQRKWNPAVESVDLGDLTPHDMRHTAVSLWIHHGASALQVAHRAGHTSVVTVMRVYGHLYEEDEDKLVASLDAAIG